MTDRLFPVPPQLTEREWQTVLQERFTAEGYKWMHVYRMPTVHGKWRTSTTSPGWPDLIAIRAPWLVVCECKKLPKDTPSDEQLEWLERFASLPYGRAWCLRPTDDWQKVANWIHNPEDAPANYGWVRAAQA